MDSTFFRCLCEEEKPHQLIFDGGSSGNYQVELCSNCYKNQDKKFLIEEVVTGIGGRGRPNSIPVTELDSYVK